MTLSVRAAGVATLLDDATGDIAVLSLDCFDTLLWRNSHAPDDIFTELKAPGGAVIRRRKAEALARQLRQQQENSTEVSIDAICAQLAGDEAPGEAAIEQLAHAELAAERLHCFAFAPVVALMRAARARSIQVVIVSDTYLSAVQLRALIADVAGQDVADAIDVVFCSSEYGLAKSEGLFELVIARLKVAPGTILHLGDNRVADHLAPTALGIRAVHFEQFDAAAEQQLRFEAAVARTIEPATGVTIPTMQPHRAALSMRRDLNPVARLGHDVLGPIMLGFAHWVRAEADALASATGRPVKVLFLLRDGHLPSRAYQAARLGTAATVEISRFTARRASFTDAAAIRSYLRAELTRQVPVLGRQLLLTEAEIATFASSDTRFRKAMLDPRWVATIVERSRAFADRLAAHVRERASAAPGDLLMLVDLGYQGSVQDLSHAALGDRLGVAIAGRYLLLSEILSRGLDKKGLLDARNYDCRLLVGLGAQVSALEQLCTTGVGSVVDYGMDGTPVRRFLDVGATQSATREEAQEACLAFISRGGEAKHRPAASDGAEASRRMVAATLARLLLLPRADEVRVLETFDHDVNLGTSELALLINPEAASTGLRQRGLGYLHGAKRMFLPGEVQSHGLPLSLSLLATTALGLDLRQCDFQTGGMDVPILLLAGAGEMMSSATAYPTHDGYYLLMVPWKADSLAVGIQIGRVAEIVQIESLAVHQATTFAAGELSAGGAVTPVLDRMDVLADGLHRCGDDSLVFVPPTPVTSDGPHVLAFVFRPVVRRPATFALSKAA